MGSLKPIALAVALLMGSPTRAEAVGDWRPIVVEASARFGVPVAWIERVIQAESRGRTMLGGRPIVSPKGAMGLMQLMPTTWADMRAAYDLGSDPHDPHDNIIAGTAYLRALYDRFGYPGLFAAYNAGPARYAAYLAGRATLPGETRNYLAALSDGTKAAAPTAVVAAQPAPPSLFVVRRAALPVPDAASEKHPLASLFVTLSDR